MKFKFGFPGKLLPQGKEKEQRYCSYCPYRNPPTPMDGLWNEYKLAIIIFFAAVIILFASMLSYAQERGPVPLKVGDQLPPIHLQNVLNGTGPEADLADYQDQLLILDFWSTSCGTCINEMPNVAALIKKYAGKVKIIEVDYEPEKAVFTFYRRRPEIKALGIPVAVGDKQLNALFLHRFQPHIVWIDHGIYKGATEGGYLTTGNIDSMLHQPQVILNQKIDLPPDDRSKAAFSFSNPGPLKLYAPVYGSFFTGHIQGKSPSSGSVRDSLGQTQRVFFYNQTILNLYAYILNSPLPFQANRRILRVRDTVRFYNYQKEYDDQYDAKHTYSFETTLPVAAAWERATEELKSTMEAVLAIRGMIEQRETEAFALVVSGNGPVGSAYARQDVHDTPGLPVQLHHIDAAYLAELMNDTKGVIPVIDETGSKRYFDIDLPAMPQSAAEWEEVLKQHGFKLMAGKMNLDFFVLTENGLPGPAENTSAHKISN